MTKVSFANVQPGPMLELLDFVGRYYPYAYFGLYPLTLLAFAFDALRRQDLSKEERWVWGISFLVCGPGPIFVYLLLRVFDLGSTRAKPLVGDLPKPPD